MKINDKYHDRFKTWCRDFKDADIDYRAGKWMIQQKALLDSSEVTKELFLPLSAGVSLVCLSVGAVNRNVPLEVMGSGVLGLSVLPLIYSSYLDSKFDKIHKTANYQRYFLGEDSKRKGAYVRGASSTSGLDQL